MEKVKKRGIFIGLAVVDFVYNLDKLPEEDTKLKCEDYYMSFGGPALKAALVYASLGGKATLISYIGDSDFGMLLKNHCKKKNIDIIDLANDKDLPGMSVIGIVKEKATRTILSGQRSTKGGLALPEPYDLEGYDFCLYDCNFPDKTIEIINLLKEANIELILDAGSWKENIDYALNYAKIVISSSVFASPEGKDILELQDEYNLKMVAKTNNEKPIFWCAKVEHSMGRGKIFVEPIKNISTLGAGDVFHGSFCFYFYQLGEAFSEALVSAIKYTNKFLKTPERERI